MLEVAGARRWPATTGRATTNGAYDVATALSHPPIAKRTNDMVHRYSLVLAALLTVSSAGDAVIHAAPWSAAAPPARGQRGGTRTLYRGTAPAMASRSRALGATRPVGDCSPGTTKRAMGRLSASDAALAQFIGRKAGKRLAGNAPLTVDATRARVLGNQIPTGARIDACADRITFTTTTVSVVVEASPPHNPDMTFRLAGLVDPTVVVPLDARITVEFINADNDEAHGWMITPLQPPFAFWSPPGSRPAFVGASAGVIGDPTPAGQGARIVTFTVSTAGAYQYICPMPGHAQMGMHGAVVVR